MSGAPDRIRTCGLQLRRLSLYPAELRARLTTADDDDIRHEARLKPDTTTRLTTVRLKPDTTEAGHYDDD